jgi:hypothetical protein
MITITQTIRELEKTEAILYQNSSLKLNFATESEGASDTDKIQKMQEVLENSK